MKKLNKEKIIIFLVVLLVGVGITSNYLNKNGEVQSEKQVDYSKMSIKEVEKSFLDNLLKGALESCKKILASGTDLNRKDDNGQTLYSKAVNVALEDFKNDIAIGKYSEIFNVMKDNGANQSLVKIHNKQQLSEKQKKFLMSIGIDTRSEKEKQIEKQKEELQKQKEELQKQKDENIAQSKNNQNFSMNGLELIEQGTTKDGLYIIGKIRNNNGFNCSYAEVKAKITDNNDNVLDTPIDNITSLESGEVWSFNIPVIVDRSKGYKYQIIEMICN